MESLSKEEIEYWLFSNADEARLCRCCREVTLKQVTAGVTQEQAEEMCAKIREHLESGEFYEIYVKVLMFYNDTSALDILHDKLQYYKEKNRSNMVKRVGGGFTSWIRLLKDAIKHLKRVERASKNGFWAKTIGRIFKNP